ncbi:unnamed protein product [Aphanomyces euteiches]
MLQRQKDEDDDPMSPDFKDSMGKSSLYGAPPGPATVDSIPPPRSYEQPVSAPDVTQQPAPIQPTNPSPVPVLSTPAVEYHNIQANATIMNTFRSADEDMDFDRPSEVSIGESFDNGNAWTRAMNKQHEVVIDDVETNSYNSANHSAFNDEFDDSQSEGSRASTFMTRNTFQSHMSSDMDHHDFPSHNESTAERGSYEL